MKAAVLTKLNGKLEIADVGLTDLNYGQVLVRVLVSGICGAQLQEIAGNKGNAHFIPHLLGHEGAGIVEAVGVGVNRVKVGDKVVMHWRKADGIEADFPQYIFNGKRIRSGKVITFAEQAIVSENRLTPVPKDTPNDLCALLGCGLSTALASVESESNIKFGESVLIIGCGGLGINLIHACYLRGATPIFATDFFDDKKELATKLGAKFLTHKDIVCNTDKKCFDVIYDTAGSIAAMDEAFQLLAPSGRYIMVGQPKPGDNVVLNNINRMFEGNGKTITATQGGGFRPELDLPRYVKLWRAGKVRLDDIVTHRVTLDNINDGIEFMRSGAAGRVMVDIQ